MNKDSSNESSTSSRRYFLGKMGAALGAGALVASSAAAHGALAEAPALHGIVDIRNHGAKGDGITNDAPAIQAVIDILTKRGGGVVWIPPGMYLIGSPLIVTEQVMLCGAGWGTTLGPSLKTIDYIKTDGSKLYVTDTKFVPVTLAGRGSTMRDLAIYHKQPDPAPGWMPAPYPTAISIGGDDVRLENIFLHNPTIGITSVNVGRLTLNRIFGQPLKIGVSIDNAEDVVKMDNLHFWPFWNFDAPVKAYMNANANAIVSYRNDNPHFSNIFALGYHIGFLFDQSTSGITSKFRIVNADNDGCYMGIHVAAANVTGQVSNYTFQGADPPQTSSTGIFAGAPAVVLQLTNIRTTGTGDNGVRAEGDNTMLMIDNIWCQSWDQSGKGFPAIEAASKGANIKVGLNRFFTSGSANYIGGVGTIVLG